MSAVSGKAFDGSLLRRVFAYTKPYRSVFYGAVLLTVVIAAIAPLRPILTQYTLDNHLPNGNYKGLLTVTIWLLALLILQCVLQYYHAYATNLLGQNVIRDMRVKLFDRLVHFRLSFFDKTPVGTTVTRCVSDMETIADIFSEGLIVIIGDFLQVIVIISVMLWLDWELALISLSTIPLLMIATRIFQKKIKDTFGDVRTQVARLNTFVQEHLTGMSVIQIFNSEEREYKKFEAINSKHRDANIRSVWYYSIFFPVVEILSAISIGLIVWFGTGGVIKGHTTFGDLVAFIMYINMLFRPIRELADKFNTLQMGMVSSERIFKLIDEDELTHEGGNQNPGVVKGEIEFKDVWFAYNYHNEKEEATDWILKGVSFKVNAGATAAFVGATGAGKSTIISLLNRFYEISKGNIYIDGIDIRDYPVTELRSRIAVVLQDVFLFSDTIENNIRLSDQAITTEKIIDAAKQTGVHDFISKLPEDYRFNVGERGVMLSMGQRQILAFIRAFVHNPLILVLDEATSSVDSETEELLSKATGRITSNRTSIVIAHRLSTVQNADCIYVLQSGKIIEQGTHEELLKQNGEYKSLYEIQFSHFKKTA